MCFCINKVLDVKMLVPLFITIMTTVEPILGIWQKVKDYQLTRLYDKFKLNWVIFKKFYATLNWNKNYNK